MKRLAILITILVLCLVSQGKTHNDTSLVVKINLKEEVGPTMFLKLQQAFDKAQTDSADLIILHINTYGGTVVDADSIRTRILNSKIPVYAFIDNNAASAGALIAIACDKIYMRRGASIGAATAVNQSGEALPDKYQSYIRSIIRSTAEAHGRDTIINGTDTTYKWHRNPQIAEAMVDQDIQIDGIIDAGKTLTFTSYEAQKHGFCDGLAESIDAIIDQSEYAPAEIREYKPSNILGIHGWLLNPAVQSLLIMAIIGGLYFEMQSPGIGFPSIISVMGAILYFAPLYLEGLASHWEIVLFVIGIALLVTEIFAFPGFGFFGITGIIVAVTGLTFAMVENYNIDDIGIFINGDDILKAFLLVIISISGSIILCIWITSKFYNGSIFGNKLSLSTTQQTKEGFVSVDIENKQYIGKTGIAETVLRPSGRISIDGELFDAKAEDGYIDKGCQVTITRFETGQLYVKKTN